MAFYSLSLSHTHTHTHTQPSFIKDIVDKMERIEFVTDTLALGESKFMVNNWKLCTLIIALINALYVIYSNKRKP